MVMHIALFFASVGLIALSKLVLSHWTDEHVVEAVRAALADFPAQTLYACGPKPMLLALAAFCKDKQLSGQFSWEAMMRCGIGLCGSCEIDEPTCDAVGLAHGWLTCKDGPVSILEIEQNLVS